MKNRTPIIPVLIVISCIVIATLFACGAMLGQGMVNSAHTNIVPTNTDAATNENKQVIQDDIIETIYAETQAEEENATPNPTPQEEAQIAELLMAENVFIGNIPNLLIDCVNFNPHRIWYEDDYLYVDMYVTNGLSNSVFNIKDVYLKISNEQGVIAEADFSSMQDAIIGSHQTIIWTFIFGGDAVITHDADLTGMINTRSSSAYNY